MLQGGIRRIRVIRGIRVIRVIRKILICTASAQGTERSAPRGWGEGG